MTLCANCGSEYAAGLQAACRDCRLASDPASPPSLPDLEDGPDEMLFDLSLWPAEERVALGLTLDERGIPWRWEPGPDLVVRESDQVVVEELLDEEEGDDEDWEDVSEADRDESDLDADLAIDADDEVADGEDGDEPEDDDEPEDGGEEAAGAMGGLFDAADRLMHNPANVEALVDVDRLASLVADSLPPYGIEPKTWEQVGVLADAVLAASDEEDVDAVAAASKSLRDFLRTYV